MQTALSKLVEQHQPMLVAYSRALMKGNDHAADDLMQEAFLTACRRMSEFREGADFGAWLRGIARLKAMEMWRNDQRSEMIQDPEVLEGMEETFMSFDLRKSSETSWKVDARRRLESCLSQLPDGLRSIVSLVYENGMELRSVCAQLQLSEAAAYQRLSRAREVLRQCVQKTRVEEDLNE
ncbi:MAG: sigma-70 family RNA polymerase sigma factor [Planctomyces sp.]|nr:sigma-70 family RNA polymerase sigma factor [Planctomyces sp.]